MNSDELNKLQKIIKDFSVSSGGCVKYVPNQGNAGDALISTGMWQLFDSIGFEPKVCSLDQIQQGDFAIYSGGGNFVPEYSECRSFVEKCLNVGCARVLILPHTIRGNEDLLKLLDERFIIICRDFVSFDFVKNVAVNANVVFCPDTAFFIDLKKLEESVGWGDNYLHLAIHFVFRPKQLTKFFMWLVYCFGFSLVARDHLDVFRVDVESTANVEGSRYFDISNHYGSKYQSRYEVDAVSIMFLRLLQKAKSIKTNRLHVAIGGAILGKTVELLDNSYGKNKAIYQAYLYKYENVRFLE